MVLSKATRAYFFWLWNSGHKRTAIIYRSVLEELPDVPLTEVTPQMLSEFVQKWNGLAPATANLRKSALRSFFGWCVDNDWLMKSPARLLKDTKVMQAEARYLTEMEVDKFRAVIKGNARDELLFSIYLMCGCRLRELLALNVADVRGKDVVSIVGKGNKARNIFLNGYLTGLVGKVIAGCEEAAPLFMSALGRRLSPSRVGVLLKTYCIRAGIKIVSPHGLRHTFLTMLYSATRDILLCGAAAGHSQVRTTQRYCHVNESQVQQAVCGLWKEESWRGRH